MKELKVERAEWNSALAQPREATVPLFVLDFHEDGEDLFEFLVDYHETDAKEDQEQKNKNEFPHTTHPPVKG